MKKLFALLLAVMMVAMLAACGGSPSSTGGDASTPVTSTPAEAGAASKLTVWCWDPAFNIYAMEQAAAFYQKENPDCEIEVVEVPWDDIQTRITTAAAAGDYSSLPDILLCQNNAFQKNVINYPDLFLDLTGSSIAFDQFGASVVAYSQVDGKNYGVPFDNGAAVNAIRTDILEQAGYTIDDFKDITWDEYIEKGKDVLAKTGKPMVSMASDSADMFMMMLQSCGASLFNEDGTPNIANNDSLKEALAIQKELIDSGVMLLVNNWDEYVASFVDNKVASALNGCWILGSVQDAEDQAGNWAVTNVPKMNIAGATNYTANGGSSWGICSNSQNSDLAIDFLSKTFAGSVEFYETILPASGALANYLPAGESSVYENPQDFFAGQAIYADIVEFSKNVPSNTGAYYYEARDAVNNAAINIMNGADMNTELQAAEDELIFAMGG